MNQHPYLRAYMAGIVTPTLVLLVATAVFTVARYVCQVPLAIERLIIFPMTVVPNLWGLWNIIWVALPPRRQVSIGVFGALLPFVLAPGGLLLAHLFRLDIPHLVPYLFPIGVIIYYLIWKHVVGRLNAIIGIA